MHFLNQQFSNCGITLFPICQMTQSCSTKSGLIALDPLFGNALNLKITETKKNTRYRPCADDVIPGGANYERPF